MGRAVRLACVRHAASVRPEPGSNSPKKVCLALSPNLLKKFFWASYLELYSNLKGSHFGVFVYCLIFKDHSLRPFLSTANYILPSSTAPVKGFLFFIFLNFKFCTALMASFILTPF